MSYTDDHLLPGEEVRHRARVHKINYIAPAVVSVLFIAAAGWLLTIPDMGMIAGLVALLGVVPLIGAYISYTSSEFSITNKRVIIKTGWIQRRTLETLLGKIEGISVDQGVMGRLLGYGTLTITGTGGTHEPFPNIADPLEFRRQVQAQVTAADDARMMMPASGAAPREERDCPHCAERILTRAKVCKHCGRDVEPSASR